jgi:LemA protein
LIGGFAMKNKKGLIIALAVIAVIAIFAGSIVSSYNSLVDERETVTNAQANIQTMLQRRADLIPNLVNTVKGYAAHEEEVYTAIADARSKLSGATTVDEMEKANSELDSAISRLLVVVENYPELKADTQFINLQDELAGSENRISVARKDYNDVAKAYNTHIKKFPANIIASMFNFEQAEYFEASSEAQTAPSVNFD